MADAPSIKGALIVKLVEDVTAFLERESARREVLLGHFSADSRALLTDGVNVARWYPIHVYSELTECIWQGEGGGDLDYLRQRGAEAMQRVMENGLYQQLEFVTRKMVDLSATKVPLEALLRSIRLVNSFTGSIRNFGRDSIECDPDYRGVILNHVREAEAYPEPMRYVSEGSLTYLSRIAWPEAPPTQSQRPTPDHIIFISDYTGAILS